MKKINLLSSIYFLFLGLAIGQGSGAPLGNLAYPIMDRLEIRSGIQSPFHTEIKPYLRGDLTAYAIQLDSTLTDLTKLDRRDLQYIFNDNNEWLDLPADPTTLTGPNELSNGERNITYVDSTKVFYRLGDNPASASWKSRYYVQREKPLLKYFYKTPANLFELNTTNFQLKINPIINFKVGRAQDDEELIFQNTRGIEVRGAIDDRIFFYSNILENQSRFADYVGLRIERDQAIPGNNFYKDYSSSLFNITNGYDYLNAQGYIGFNVTKHVGVQFGHGRNFIGNGYRSLLLSDFSTNYFYLKFNTKVWKFHFQNIFAEMTPIAGGGDRGDGLLPKKYIAAHYLSFRPTSNFSIGLYEAIVFSRNNNFELQYLNPIILYRTVEQFIGSPDNALLGLNVKLNVFQRFQLYGQLMLDEFKFDELLIERNGWWANKYGIQLGLKYVNTFGIDHLDTQVEHNYVRPYTYTHRDSSASYTHYSQPLAHPLGANFEEYIFKVRYQPAKKWLLEGRVIYANYGEDAENLNWGGNILKPHNSRVMEYENEVGQGVGTQTLLAGIDLTYELYHNVYLDLHYLYRRQESDLAVRNLTTNYIGGGFRMNIGKVRNDF